MLLLFAPTMMNDFWSVTGAIAFTQAIREVYAFWYFWIPLAFLAAMIVLGPIPGYSNRLVRWQSSFEENCRKGTDS